MTTEDKVHIGGERDYKKGKIAELATITYIVQVGLRIKSYVIQYESMTMTVQYGNEILFCCWAELTLLTNLYHHHLDHHPVLITY